MVRAHASRAEGLRFESYIRKYTGLPLPLPFLCGVMQCLSQGLVPKVAYSWTSYDEVVLVKVFLIFP